MTKLAVKRGSRTAGQRKINQLRTSVTVKRGRKRGRNTITLFRMAWDQLRDEPTGTIAIIEGYKFRKTRPDKIQFPG